MQTATWLAPFEAHARAVAERGEIPGMAVAVARRGETVYEGSFGERRLGGGADVTPDTMFGIGSANALLARPLDTPLRDFPEYPATPADLARITGAYRAERQTLRFYLDGDSLKVAMRGRQLDARPYASDSVVVGKNMPARFLTDNDGSIWAVSFGLCIYPKVE